MNQVARCDWLRLSHLARLGLPAVSRKKNFPESHKINRSLTKSVRSRWLDIGLVLFFCELMDLDFVSVHKDAKKKKEFGQYPVNLTSHLLNNPYILIEQALTIIYIYLDRVTQLEPIVGWEVSRQCSTPGEWVTLAQWGFSVQFGF